MTKPEPTLRELLADGGATKAPWEIMGDGRQAFAKIGMVVDCATQLADDDDETGLEEDDARARRDIAFIAKSRNLWPLMLDALAAAEELASKHEESLYGPIDLDEEIHFEPLVNVLDAALSALRAAAKEQAHV